MSDLLAAPFCFFARKLRGLWQSEAGNVAMMLGLSIIPLVVAAGTAMDYSRIVNAKTNLVAALDSSGIYAATVTGKTEPEIKTLARAYLDKNYTNGDDAVLTDFDLQTFSDHVEVTGTVNVRTWFMAVVGIRSVEVPAASVVRKGGRNLEVALVLDNTYSMSLGTKLADLKKAANDFVDMVVTHDKKPYYAKVSLVPYGNGVNLGALAEQVRGPISPGTNTSPGWTSFEFNNVEGTTHKYTISTCVSERTGPKAYTDAAVRTNPVGLNYPSDVNPCIATEVLPLTDNAELLKKTIDGMTPDGSTAAQVGIAWGWYTLSPNFGLWTGDGAPAPYPGTSNDLHKVLVIMTDADLNNAYCNGVISGVPEVGSSNFPDRHINCAAANGNPYEQSTKLCAAIKNAGIEIYTVEFELNPLIPESGAMMGACATDKEHRITASDSSQLGVAFQQIAANLKQLYISQ